MTKNVKLYKRTHTYILNDYNYETDNIHRELKTLADDREESEEILENYKTDLRIEYRKKIILIWAFFPQPKTFLPQLLYRYELYGFVCPLNLWVCVCVFIFFMCLR